MRKVVLSPQSQSLRPRAGQHLVLEFFDLRIPGTVESIRWDTIRFLPDSSATAGVLRERSHLAACYALAQGVVTARFILLGHEGRFVHLELSGEPTIEQRRHHPRVNMCIPAALTWRVPGGTGFVQLAGRTQNLSLGGARLRFDQPFPTGSTVPTTTYLELDLPGGPASMVAKVLQLWDDGARLRLVVVEPEDEGRLAELINERLAGQPWDSRRSQ